VVLSVAQVLDAVAELREASLQLVCWELNVEEGEARPAFERAVADGLLARRGVDEVHNEVMYALTDPARRILEGGGVSTWRTPAWTPYGGIGAWGDAARPTRQRTTRPLALPRLSLLCQEIDGDGGVSRTGWGGCRSRQTRRAR
jgi:hypothetical protein